MLCKFELYFLWEEYRKYADRNARFLLHSIPGPTLFKAAVTECPMLMLQLLRYGRNAGVHISTCLAEPFFLLYVQAFSFRRATFPRSQIVETISGQVSYNYENRHSAIRVWRETVIFPCKFSYNINLQ